MADSISAIFSGLSDIKKTANEVNSKIETATVAALRANQNKIKTAVRQNLRGDPRWTERAGRAHGGTSFQVEGTTGQHNSPRDGGPGKMTGDLYNGVGGVKKPKKRTDGLYYGGVGVGGKINNFKKNTLEAKYPYFKPAIDKVMPLLSDAFVKGWSKAVNKLGGF